MIGAIVVFILLQYLSEARVDFEHSQIYDEFDFKGQSSVTIDGLCKDSCHIFASITEESNKFASNILIQTSKGFVSVADVAARFDSLTKQKLFLEVNKTTSLTIVNTNSQLAAGPLVLYVVNRAGDFFNSAEIYEASGFRRPVSTLVQALTVMSAYPFTLTQARHEGDMAGASQKIAAQMSGFDALEESSATCPKLYYLEYKPFPGFNLEVNGPIVSVKYDANQVSPGELTATLGITNIRDLERSGWMGSPGYHGCIDKQPYRSSLYDYSSWFHGEISSDQQESTVFIVDTNTNATHPVVIRDKDYDGFYAASIDDTGNHPFEFGMTAKNWTINWMPDGSDSTHFMIRWSSTIVPL